MNGRKVLNIFMDMKLVDKLVDKLVGRPLQ